MSLWNLRVHVWKKFIRMDFPRHYRMTSKKSIFRASKDFNKQSLPSPAMPLNMILYYQINSSIHWSSKRWVDYFLQGKSMEQQDMKKRQDKELLLGSMPICVHIIYLLLFLSDMKV